MYNLNYKQLISIIIPLYNTQQYLSRCLESV
ncbi:glycosyltransferase family 2 protein, partial [Francisella tularensis subsp. holarctica]|nr:glycosyltransferase family 2 protein [Francisella tularensis subsp. holarctica]